MDQIIYYIEDKKYILLKYDYKYADQYKKFLEDIHREKGIVIELEIIEGGFFKPDIYRAKALVPLNVFTETI